MTMKNWLIIYDIRDERRLAKVAKVAIEYCNRVQKSVFEVYTTVEIINRIRKRINKIIDKSVFVVYFELCGSDWRKQMKFGPEKYGFDDEKDFAVL